MERLRYLGIGKETDYGDEVPALFHLDVASAGLDSPAEQLLVYGGGLQRFTRRICPGPYRSEGPVEFAADISTMDLILSLLLGTRNSSSAGVTPVTDEIHSTGVGETSLSFTLANTSINRVTLLIHDGVTTQYAHDDGFGNIVEDGASGITGTINYATGAVALTGLTESTDYYHDYSYGFISHTISPKNDDVLDSATLRLGKDNFEHMFVGCAISQLTLSVEREFLTFAIDIVGGEDSKETITPLANLKLIKHCPVAFHNVDLRVADKGVTPVSISAKVNSLELVINNNSSTEMGMGLNSRFPNAAFAGEFELTGTMNLRFENTTQKEDFWGAATGPSADGPTEKNMDIYMDSGGWGNALISLPRAVYQTVAIQPSGKDKLMEDVAIIGYQDEITGAILSVIVNNLIDWLA